jgi:hypothetical protein
MIVGMTLAGRGQAMAVSEKILWSFGGADDGITPISA